MDGVVWIVHKLAIYVGVAKLTQPPSDASSRRTVRWQFALYSPSFVTAAHGISAEIQTVSGVRLTGTAKSVSRVWLA